MSCLELVCCETVCVAIPVPTFLLRIHLTFVLSILLISYHVSTTQIMMNISRQVAKLAKLFHAVLCALCAWRERICRTALDWRHRNYATMH